MTNQEFFINSWQREIVVTAKAFRSLPNDLSKLSKQHHPKFRSPWEIVNHIAPHAKELSQAVSEGRIDLVNEGKFDLKGPTIFKSPEDAAKSLEENSAKLVELVKKCDENTWMTKQIPAFWGPREIFKLPLMQICWTMHNDLIHHRGQLSSYYRIIGASQPSIYGPTAEMEEEMMAKSN